MRINPIATNSMTKIRNNSQKESTKNIALQPTKADTVQFKADLSAVEEFKRVVERNQCLKFSPKINERISNQARIKRVMRELINSINQLPQNYVHPMYHEKIKKYLENTWLNSFGDLSKIIGISPDNIKVLIKDHNGNILGGVKNLGKYVFNPYKVYPEQSLLFFINPDTDNFISFSNNNRGSLAYTTSLGGRHEFYENTERGLPYWNHSDGDFWEPISFNEKYNKDGSMDKWEYFLRSMRNIP